MKKSNAIASYDLTYQVWTITVLFGPKVFFVRSVAVYAGLLCIGTRMTFGYPSEQRAVFEAENALRLRNLDSGRLLKVEKIS